MTTAGCVFGVSPWPSTVSLSAAATQADSRMASWWASTSEASTVRRQSARPSAERIAVTFPAADWLMA